MRACLCVSADYTRTAIAFTIIAIIIMIIGHSFAFYAVRRPRYIIKRLAALLHFMTAACLLVLNEVFVKTVEHEKEHMPERIPPEAHTEYGFSFVLSWISFVLFVLAGLVFLLMSHKRKPEYADNNDAIEDEPMQLGRR
ncbi:LOW QUALITY PROTEIN: peripheral myelin protein 22-like [Pomacea canaliculata]|uniref:LOW QUALITY PROTEIN: peripheral myelin protein 22-like n=1 Tax=Pomacea canaliculata TaxID=400727 RepID=UPI000D72F0B1|nr:LOW QUALITY PROTEIN: peripheral myelin protein 22-like [Pomacea canaliculata]